MSVNEFESLRALIAARRQAEGMSWRQAQTRAKQFGFARSHESLRQWAELTELPSAEQLRILSLVFDVPPMDLIRASLLGMGYDLDLPTSVAVEDAISGDGRLSSYDKSLLTALVGAMLDNQGEDQSETQGGSEASVIPRIRTGRGDETLGGT